MPEDASGIIDQIHASVPPLTRAEKRLSKEETRRYEVETHGIEQEQEERKKYAHRVFVLCCCWVSAIYVMLMFAGFGSYVHFKFHLSETILLAAIGSTTANIIGVFLIVVRYIFPDRKERTKSN